MKSISKRTIITIMSISLLFLITGCSSSKLEQPYDRASFGAGPELTESGARMDLFAADLCVTDEDITAEGLTFEQTEGAGLFDVEGKEVLYAKNVHEKLYPASTTKILTALIAIKGGYEDDEVTVGDEVTGFAWDEQICGLEPGDTLSMEDLLHGLLINSGNDAANAIAVHIAGSVDEFARMMNEEARALGATNSNFLNPHGLHEEEHYSTAYDLYVVFQAAVKYDLFREIIHLKSYTADFESGTGEDKSLTWQNTNQYLRGEKKVPDGVTVIGGKTGTTGAAGSCLVLLSEDKDEKDYISVILKAEGRAVLYNDMTELIGQINK